MEFLMIENLVELVVISTAAIVSRAKLIPFALIIYNMFYQLVNALITARYYFEVENYYNYVSGINDVNESLMVYYISNGVFMALIASLFFLLQTRMSMLIAIAVLTQSALTVSMAIVTYSTTQNEMDLTWVFDVYSSIDSKFVIIYCVIAWICVFLSRKSAYG